jgi:broad specificity phosphatase PhoE
VRGIAEKYPELHAQRQHVGKFYFRPPGGESWCDVILRLRSLLDTLNREYAGERVLIVAHQVIVNCFRYLLERMDEATILEQDRAADVPNCSVTSYAFDPARGKRGKLAPQLVNFVAPLEARGTPVTTEADISTAAKA